MIAALLVVLAADAPLGTSHIQGIPMAEYSDFPCAITVGVGAETPSTAFEVVVRSDREIQDNSTVVVDFAMCPGIVKLAMDQPGGQTADCALRSVRAFSDQNGIARFNIRASWAAQGEPDTPCIARIYADGVFFAAVPVATFDLSGDGELTATDLSLVLEDQLRFAHRQRTRSDFDRMKRDDCELGLSAADLSVWLSAALYPAPAPVSFCP